MKLLIVEDEHNIGNYLKQGLIEAGFIVDWVTSGLDGLHHAITENYDLFVFDIMLPELNGWQLTETIRKTNKATPILLLTALDRVEDKVKGLELGADDYLVKPFAFAEILARIRTLLRRGNNDIQQTQFQLADLHVDILKRRITRQGQRIELTSKEFCLLEFLLRHQGEVLPRSLIASQVWDMNFDSDTNVIDVAIKRLRQKIDAGYTPKLIHTIRGMGYLLELRDE